MITFLKILGILFIALIGIGIYTLYSVNKDINFYYDNDKEDDIEFF